RSTPPSSSSCGPTSGERPPTAGPGASGISHAEAASAAIPRKGEIAGLDLGLATGDEIGDDAAGPGGHGPAERAMAGVEEEVRVPARAAEHGRAVRRHRPQAAPE